MIHIKNKELNNLDTGLERISYPIFLRQYQLFRLSELTSKLKKVPDTIQLPINSVLHLLDNIKRVTLNEQIVDTPNTNTPFINNETNKPRIYHQTNHIPTPIQVPKDYIYRENGLIKNLQLFRFENRSRFIYESNLSNLAQKGNYIGIVNHNPMFRTFCRGALSYFRSFNAIFASILNLACSLDEKQHYFLIPLVPKIYPKTAFIRAFDKITFGSLTDRTSYQYCFFVHLYTYINPDAKTESIFNQIPEYIQQLITFIFECENQYLIVNLKDLKSLNNNNTALNKIINRFNTYLLEALAIKENKVDEIDTNQIDKNKEDNEEKAEEILVDNYNKISKDHKATIDIDILDDKEDNAKEDQDDQELQSILSEITGLTNVLNNNQLKQVVKSVDVKDVDIVKSEIVKDEESYNEEEIKDLLEYDLPSDIKLPDGKTQVANTAEEFSKITENYIDYLESRAKENIKNNDKLTPARKERAYKLIQQYKAVTLDGETLQEILKKKVDPNIKVVDMSNLDNVLVDKSMNKSSICGMTRSYFESGMYKRDLVLTAISLTPQGMYLTDIKKDVVVNQLDLVENYSFKYQTVEGKKHLVKFQLPKVLENGRCKVGGVDMMLKKQVANKPICKVSPTRVSLASNYNKTIVERKTSVAHTFLVYLDQLINAVNKVTPDTIKVTEEITRFPEEVKLPLEYVDIAAKYGTIAVKHKNTTTYTTFTFKRNQKNKVIEELEVKYKSIYIGNTSDNNTLYFMRLDSSVLLIDVSIKPYRIIKSSILDIISKLTQTKIPKVLTEWTEIKILDRKFPVIFLLGFRYGLFNVLNYLKCKYIVFNRRSKKVVYSNDPNLEEYKRKQSDVVIRFNEVDLIVPRYPLFKSLIVAGLAGFDLGGYMIEEFDHKDVYYSLLGNKHNYLRGIANLYDLFVDPKTFEILQQMHEPTNPRDLLIRATQMLTTSNYHEASSIFNHRIRGYDRLMSIAYNEIARSFADFRRKSGSEGATFSINPKSVLLRIISDPSMQNIEDQNPIHDIKATTALTYVGAGGRTSESFVHTDRRYPKDGVGIISEATVDSGKVAINAQSTMNPLLTNEEGFGKENIDIYKLKPTNIFSVNSLFLPGTSQDNGLRLNLSNSINSHVLPTKDGEVARVRTGYEKVMPILADDIYAYSAKEDGTVLDVNESLKMVTIQYKSGKIYTFTYDDIYGLSSDLVTTQRQTLKVKKGDKFKKNDILRYNPEFFEIDFENPSGCSLKHGIVATVALVDNSVTFEDSNVVTKEFGKRLEIKPVTTRVIDIPIDSVIHEFKYVNSEVLSSDPLLIFEDAESSEFITNPDDVYLDYVSRMNRLAPKAKFTGKIVKINCFYHRPISEMHPSLANVVRRVIKLDNQKAEYSKNTNSNIEFIPSTVLPKDSKYKGINLSEDNVIFQFFIQETIENGIGDKIVIDTALKSVTSTVLEIQPRGEKTNRPINVLYSANGVINRILNSPYITGTAETILEKVEENILNMYFE